MIFRLATMNYCVHLNVATNLKMVNVAQLKLVILICAVHDILVLAILANEVVFHFGLQVCCQNIYSGSGTLE